MSIDYDHTCSSSALAAIVSKVKLLLGSTSPRKPLAGNVVFFPKHVSTESTALTIQQAR